MRSLTLIVIVASSLLAACGSGNSKKHVGNVGSSCGPAYSLASSTVKVATNCAGAIGYPLRVHLKPRERFVIRQTPEAPASSTFRRWCHAAVRSGWSAPTEPRRTISRAGPAPQGWSRIRAIANGQCTAVARRSSSRSGDEAHRAACPRGGVKQLRVRRRERAG